MLLHFLFLVSCFAVPVVESQLNCTSCTECVANISQSSSLCKCDSACDIYGDCCASSSAPASCTSPSNVPLKPGVVLECHSIFSNPAISVLYENEAFLMVSSCPDSWPVEQSVANAIASNCTSQDLKLPPVTDRESGIVYKNEHCALCNGIRQLVAWNIDIACAPTVYKLLESKPTEYIEKNHPNLFTRNCQVCSYRMPPSVPPPRSCVPSVSTCLPKENLEPKIRRILNESKYTEMVEKCVSGILNLINISSIIYKNRACALCNGEETQPEFIECVTLGDKREEVPILCAPVSATQSTDGGNMLGPGGNLARKIPFTITLSNLMTYSFESRTLHIPVNCPPGEAPIGLQCRTTQCPQSYLQTGGRCSLIGSCSSMVLALQESEYTDLGNDMILFKGRELVAVERDAHGRPLVCSKLEFLNCSTGLLPLNESEYEDLGNNTITYDGKLIKVIYYDNLGRPLICPTNESVMEVNQTALSSLPGVGELTYIGCSLSVLGTLAILITYGLFSELRTLPSKILMNLSVCLLATSLLFIIGGPVVQRFPNPSLCTAAAICLHLSNLAQLTWMTIFSIEMVRSFNLAAKFRIDPARKKNQLLLGYLIFGWTLPVVIGIICIGLNFSGRGLVLYGVLSDGRLGSCWINHFTSFIVAFLVPLLLSIVTNLVTFVVVTVLLCKASRNKSKISNSNSSALIRVWLAILSITGLTWIFGFIAIPNQGSWATYPFVIFNSSQGFIIFIAFLATKKTLLLYRDLFTGKRKKKPQKMSATNDPKIKKKRSAKNPVNTASSQVPKSFSSGTGVGITVAGGVGSAVGGGVGSPVVGGVGSAVAGGVGSAVAGGVGSAVAGGVGSAVGGGVGSAVGGGVGSVGTTMDSEL